LAAVADSLLEKPLKAKDQDVYALLLIGIYQLTDMRVPAYAAVAETVAATHDFDKHWAKNLVNGVLRTYQRQMDEIQADVSHDPEALYMHPAWFIGKVKKKWPLQWESVFAANNEHPPLALRVNQRHHTRAEYMDQLTQQDISATIIPETEMGIVLLHPMDVKQLPGFFDGDISVQDGAAQLAAELLDLAPGQRVLDACAAPGGKTAHILEREPNLAELIAVDNDDLRLDVVAENLQRLKLTAHCVHSDVGAVKEWWDGQLFDRILLDAPCSASGVIRRHPDIKLLRRPEDIHRLSQQQEHLLTALWPLLQVGGLLLYATCSIFPEENADVIARFLAKHTNAEEYKIVSAWGVDCAVGKQILPGDHGMDGFYYVRLRKTKD
jgi:16S rRNA (cytosine967-C5)-methyltransferase